MGEFNVRLLPRLFFRGLLQDEDITLIQIKLLDMFINN